MMRRVAAPREGRQGRNAMDDESTRGQEVFVTGATGVLGRGVVPALVAAGYRVRALARSEGNVETLRRLGAEPVRADLFDAGSLRGALAGCAAVLHLATSIPPSGEVMRPAAWAENDRIRVEGTRALVDAALAAGVETFIYPSVVFVYPDSGEGWIDAATADLAPTPILRSTLVAEGEVARFAADGRRGIVLRMGLFYGPRAATTEETLRLARRGVAAIFGPAEGYQPSIWTDDAAAAVVAALRATPAGTYDVVDDEPLRRGEVAVALAQAVGRRRLLRPPTWILRLAGRRTIESLLRSQRVSNRRFRAVSGWAPAVPSARAGWARLAAGRDGPGDTPPRRGRRPRPAPT
jgi:nucleoside-diphosphate-sugar epimerase